MNCHFPIHLESLAEQHKEFCSYNPETFSGLIYRIVELKCTLLIFVSGSIVITGAKDEETLSKAAIFIYPILQQYGRGQTQAPPQDDDAEFEEVVDADKLL